MSGPKRNNMKTPRESRFNNSFVECNTQPMKKPKLEIAQSSGHRIAKLNENERNANDSKADLTAFWGDDFDENDLKECEIIESQVLSQSISLANDNSSTTPQNLFKSDVSQSRAVGKLKSGTPLFRTTSAGNLPENFSAVTSDYASLTSTANKKCNDATTFLQSEVQKYKDTCNNLRDELQKKKGEASFLRSCLSRTKTDNQKKEHNFVNQIGKLKEEHSKKMAEIEKQMNEMRTDIQFKTLELNALEEKSLKSKVRNNSVVPSNQQRKSCDKTFNFADDAEMAGSTSLQRLKWGFNHLSVNVNEGSLLAKLLGADIYIPSSSEYCQPRPSKLFLFNNGKSVVEASRVEALANCLQPLMMLCKCDSFASYSARSYIKTIINECIKLMNSHIQLLQTEVLQGQSSETCKQSLQEFHSVLPLTECFSLLSSEKLYKEERGVELRRMLTIIEAIVRISKEVSKLLLPISFLVTNKNLNRDTESDIKVVKETEEKQDRMSSRREEKKNSFLHIIRDLVSLILYERRTLHYNGLLAATALLLTSLVEKRLKLTDQCQLLLLEIIDLILKSRPGPTVILYTCQLLRAASYYPRIVKNLCNMAVEKTEAEYERFYTFKMNTCPITVLCFLLQAMDGDKKYLITDVLTQWFLDLLTSVEKDHVPHWSILYPLDETDVNNDCTCPWHLSTVISTLLCESAVLYDADKKKNDLEEKLILEQLLSRGILLSYKMLQLGTFGLHLAQIEGQYELFVHTLSTMEPGIPLDSLQKEFLEEMMMQEGNKETVRVQKTANKMDIQSSIFNI